MARPLGEPCCRPHLLRSLRKIHTVVDAGGRPVRLGLQTRDWTNASGPITIAPTEIVPTEILKEGAYEFYRWVPLRRDQI